MDPLTLPIAFAVGTEADAAAAEGNYQEGQIGLTRDGRRMRVGKADGSSWLLGWPVVETAIVVNPALGGYASPQSAVVTSGSALHLLVVTLAAYSGAYTHKLLLPALETGGVAPLEGTIYEVQVTWPASVNPTLEIRNETGAGTVLWTFAGDGVAHVFTIKFLRAGGAWMRWESGEVLS